MAWKLRHFLSLRGASAAAKIRANDFAYIDELWRRWSPAWKDIPASETAAGQGGVRASRLSRGRVRVLRARSAIRLPPGSLASNITVPTVSFAGEHDGIMKPRALREGAPLLRQRRTRSSRSRAGTSCTANIPRCSSPSSCRFCDNRTAMGERPLLIFVSDIHLTDSLHGNAVSKADQFTRFWERIGAVRASGPAELCVVGDLFDLVRSPSWFEGRHRPYHGATSERRVKHGRARSSTRRSSASRASSTR